MIRALTISLSLLAAPAFAQVCPVGAHDDTPDVQAAVNANPLVRLEYGRTYCLNARIGVRIPSDRTLDLTGATVGIFPGCTVNCKAFETVPGSSNIRVIGGTIVGDLTPASGFSIGFRGDSVSGLIVEGATFRQWRYDGIWLGGNLGTQDARISGVTVEEFGRNGLSVVNGARITVERSLFRNALQPTLLGAGIDVEPNPGDSVSGLTIVDSEASSCVVGFYLHAGRGFQGYGFKLLNSRAWNNTKYGIILNSTAHAAILDNHVVAPAPIPGQPMPIGISIGATGPITSDDVIVSGNRIENTTRSLILAGVTGSKVGPNELGMGSQQIVAPSATVPGMAGLMLFTP